MKHAIMIFVILLSAQSFASRIKDDNTTIATEDDAIAINIKSCFNFMSPLEGVDARDIADFSPEIRCYILTGHVRKIQATFIKKLRAYYPNVFVLSSTSVTVGKSDLGNKINVYDLQNVYTQTVKEISRTEGCTIHAKFNEAATAAILLGRNASRSKDVMQILSRLPGLIRCE